MDIRCPHCRQKIELLADAALDEVACPSCGSHFSFYGDETVSYHPGTTRRVAHFELIERLGMGHFGAVWKARDTELDRTVAIKIPRKNQLDKIEVEQFLREARAAAQLRHANIVSVHEAGRDGDTLYIVSDFVQGATLADWLTAHPPAVREAVRLGLKIARALEHAHSQGVIHRDLKPGNIMLDAGGEPHLMDFGLAKREAGEVTMTVDGKILGTPAYMPPEQARGDSHTADRRSDVYSLGVVLFQLLTGELPFRGNARMLLLQIVSEEPPSPRRLNGLIPRDVETIVLKCLEKDPARRYQTAGDLADDLERWRNGQPISARPTGPLERGIKWARRRPMIAALISLLVLVTVVGFSAVFAEWRRAEANFRHAENARLEIEREQKKTIAAKKDADDRRREAEVAKLDAETKRKEAEASKQTAEAAALEAGRRGALLALERGRASFEKPVPDSLDGMLWYARGMAIAPKGQTDLQHAAWLNMAAWLPYTQSIRLYLHNSGHASQARYSPDGDKLAVVGADRCVTLFDLETGREIWRTKEFGQETAAVAFSPDGKTIAMGLGNWRWHSTKKGAAYLFDVATGKPVGAELKHSESVMAVEFSANGEEVWTGCRDGFLRRWEAVTGNPVGEPIRQSGPVGAIAVHRGKNLVAVSSAEAERSGPAREVWLWNPDTWERYGAALPHPNGVKGLAFHPGGEFLATAGDDSTIRIWRLADATVKLPLKHKTHSVAGVAYSPDGRTLVSAGFDYTFRVWDAAKGVLLGQVATPGFSYGAAVHPDGRSFTICTANSAVVWDFAGLRLPTEQRLPLEGGLHSARLSKDGRKLLVRSTKNSPATGQPASFYQLWDLEHGTALGSAVEHPPGNWGALALRDDGQVFGAAAKNQVAVWAADGRSLAKFSAPSHVNCLAFGPEGAHGLLAIGSDDHQLRYFDGETFQPIGEPLKNADAVNAIAFHPEGKFLAAGTRSQFQVQQFETPSGKDRKVKSNPNGACLGVRFSPDGKTYAVSEWGTWTVRLYDTETGKPASRPLRHETEVAQCLAFSPGGTVLATGGEDGRVRLWDIATGHRIGPDFVGGGKILAVGFVTEENSVQLVAFDGSKTVRRWKLPAPAAIDPERVFWWTLAITGRYLDEFSGSEVMHYFDFEEVRKNLAKLGGPPLKLEPDVEQQVNWHRYMTGKAEADQDAFAAAWHLERWSRLAPQDETVAERLRKALPPAGAEK